MPLSVAHQKVNDAKEKIPNSAFFASWREN
jgi:hypothetical protein